jgi:ribosomal-protein-alanine N-acetyltransferase
LTDGPIPPRNELPTLADLPLTFETQRLRLRPVSERDVDALWPFVSDPELTRFMSWDAHRDRAETVAWFAQCEAELAAGRAIRWVISYGGKPCGWVSLEGITWQFAAWRMDHAGLGYWLAPPLHGQGLMTEAALAATAWAFDTLGLHKVRVGCIEDNVASRRVIEKVGFRLLGREDEHLWRFDRWWNHLSYEMTATEWRETAGTRRFTRPSKPAM